MKNWKADHSLYEIAATQSGYFTAQQAKGAGYSHKNHAYYTKTGIWIKEWRGIYRLARFPEPDDSQYALWSLWSRNRKGEIQGVYTHETALDMFDISDANPARLHMTVPPGFRKTAQAPKVLVLYKHRIEPGSYEQRTGYNVLKPLPNIIMIIEEGALSEEIIMQSLRDGIQKGYFLKNQLKKMTLPDTTRANLDNLLKQI